MFSRGKGRGKKEELYKCKTPGGGKGQLCAEGEKHGPLPTSGFTYFKVFSE